MKKPELKKYLLKHNFESIGGDGEGDMFTTDNISIFIYKKGGYAHIAFAHSDSGYFEIDNPTFEQINNIIEIFNTAKYNSCGEENAISKTQFKFTVLEILKKYISGE